MQGGKPGYMPPSEILRSPVKQAEAPLPFEGFALFGFEFGPAERVKPVILDSYAVLGYEPIEDGVEHGRRDPPEFSLEIALSQALFRCPFERREEQPVGSPQRIEMSGSEGPWRAWDATVRSGRRDRCHRKRVQATYSRLPIRLEAPGTGRAGRAGHRNHNAGSRRLLGRRESIRPCRPERYRRR